MKSTYKLLRDACDKLFSIYIRLRDKRRFGGMCAICGKRFATQCFHFLSRGNLATRFEPDNAVASCSGCNLLEKNSRGNLAMEERFKSIHVSLVGQERRDELERQARTIVKMDMSDKKAELEKMILNVCGEAISIPRTTIRREPIL